MYQNDSYLYCSWNVRNQILRLPPFLHHLSFLGGRNSPFIFLHRFSSRAPNSRALLRNKCFLFFVEAIWISNFKEFEYIFMRNSLIQCCSRDQLSIFQTLDTKTFSVYKKWLSVYSILILLRGACRKRISIDLIVTILRIFILYISNHYTYFIMFFILCFLILPCFLIKNLINRINCKKNFSAHMHHNFSPSLLCELCWFDEWMRIELVIAQFDNHIILMYIGS